MSLLGKITVLFVLLATLGIGLFLVALGTVQDALEYTPTLHIQHIDTTLVSAESFVVFDVGTQTQIVTKNPDEVLPIASLTKLVTASLFYDSADLSATTSIVWADVITEGDSGRLHLYDVYSYRELVYPLLLESSNDAASTILRVQPKLLELMNAYVQNLGLTHTHFSDTAGLSKDNVSTAKEFLIIAVTLFDTNPHLFDITRLDQFIGTHTGWRNNNPLVQKEGYRGGKHGFTYEANRTVVAFFDETLASGQTRTVGYVLFGSNNIDTDITSLRAQVQHQVKLQ